MGEWLSQYLEQLQELWERLNTRAKIVIGIVSAGVLGVLVFLIAWSGNADYEILFNQLNSSDASAIVNQLEEQGLPYRLENGGQTILVPTNSVHRTRLDMAAEGLPTQGAVGFEIFDTSQFGTTDFERRVNYYRALGGELARSIQAMDAVDFAKVQITAPEDSLFIEEERPAEASVLLKFRPGFNISNNQIKAISNLVASGVQGLNPDKVTIVDTNGNLLSARIDQDLNALNSGQMSMSQFDIQREFEAGLQRDLNRMLTRVLGPGNFTVQVNARLNFDQREVESKTYSPVTDDEGIIRSQETQEENYQGISPNAEGVPGTESNLPQYQAETGQESGSNYEKTHNITNYEINEKIERHVYSPGDVQNISVAVMISQEMSEENLAKLQNSIEAAIGYNAERQDQVTVTNLAFDQSVEEEIAAAQQAAQSAEFRKSLIYGGLIAIILILMLTGFFMLRRNLNGTPNTGEEIDVTVDDMADIEAELAASSELSTDEKKRRRLKEEIEDIVFDQPEDVAELLKGWLLND